MMKIEIQDLFEAMQKASKGVNWKPSIQLYKMFGLKNLLKLQKKLINGEPIHKYFIEFNISERGKTRHIKACSFEERIAQHWFCDKILNPRIQPTLIYHNGASIPGKGVRFAKNELAKHLRKHYLHYKTEGYCLQIDFSKYFDNISHEKVYEILKKYIPEEEYMKLLKDFIQPFSKDGKGLGLGSQVSQTIALVYPNKLDHYCKEQLKIKGYGRYMDDIYLLHRSKKYLKFCLEKIKEICAELEIKINPIKTKIVKIKDGIVFLKTKFKLTDTGKILQFADSSTFKRERIRLKKFFKFLTRKQIIENYKSWRGSISSQFNSYKKLKEMDLYLKDKLEV